MPFLLARATIAIVLSSIFYRCSARLTHRAPRRPLPREYLAGHRKIDSRANARGNPARTARRSFVVHARRSVAYEGTNAPEVQRYFEEAARHIKIHLGIDPRSIIETPSIAVSVVCRRELNFQNFQSVFFIESEIVPRA